MDKNNLVAVFSASGVTQTGSMIRKQLDILRDLFC